MQSCCAEVHRLEAGNTRRCPGCGGVGRSVQTVTLKALLRPPALERLSGGDHSFCGSATCSVVYFGDGGTFRQEDLLVPVFQKCPEGRRTVCYCFAVTEDTVREEIEAGGASPSADRIKALVREGRCACEIRNPQGSCCLGNVGVLVKAAKEPRR